MTERTNRLLGGTTSSHTPAFVTLKDSGEQVPTDIHDYCGWLNAKEKRRGLWVVIKVGDDDGNQKRSLEWRAEVASDAWLREKGMAPAVGRAA